MSTSAEQYQKLWHKYQAEHDGVPESPYVVAKWAVDNGLLNLPVVDPYAIMADKMTHALREELATDAKGRRYRRNHAVRITRHGVQFSLWAELETAPRDHMLKAFAQRRRSVVGDCIQLRVDVDTYNDMHKDAEPIQMILDFTLDVAEHLAAGGINDVAMAA
ncbi:MAG: hypothetical protein JNJ46_15230 [Myxococcales bacterium]|nr:hypothetical protein [Myxococcales bacterium]